MAEQQLPDPEQLAALVSALRQQAHRVSHDLKNPLGAAREFVCLMLEEIPGPITPRQREFLETTLECCDNINKIVQTWLESVDLPEIQKDR